MLISLAMVFLFLCCSVCFAAENDSNMNLGNSISDSLNMAGEKVRNGTDDMMNAEKNMVNKTENTMSSGYNAVRTSVDEATTTTMSTTTWIWIILAVAAIVIVAMIWYYAIQDNNYRE